MADELRLSPATIGKRLKKLFDQNLLKIITRADIKLLGFSRLCQVSITNPTAALLQALEKKPDVLFTMQLRYSNQYFVFILYNQLQNLHRSLIELLSEHTPDAVFSVTEYIELYKFSFSSASFNTGQQDYLNTQYRQLLREHCDPVNTEILCRLMEDSRQSNRKIGKAINLSETSVRKRINSLTRKNLIRTGAVLDQAALGSQDKMIHGKVTTTAQCFTKTLNWLKASPHVNFLALTTGPSNLAYGAMFNTDKELQSFSSELDAMSDSHKVMPFKSPPMVFKHEFMFIL